MRFAAVLISTQMLASAASAETPSDKIVSILKNVCVTSTSSETMMTAGEEAAVAENWKLLRSGPAPMPMMHNGTGAKVSFESGWQIDLPNGAQAFFYISILRPARPGMRYNICLVQPPTDVDGDDLAEAIDRQFGGALTKDTSGRFKDQQSWFLAEEKAKGNCGKQITFLLHQLFSRGEPKALIFTDFAFLDELNSMAKSTRCPNQ